MTHSLCSDVPIVGYHTLNLPGFLLLFTLGVEFSQWGNLLHQIRLKAVRNQRAV